MITFGSFFKSLFSGAFDVPPVLLWILLAALFGVVVSKVHEKMRQLS